MRSDAGPSRSQLARCNLNKSFRVQLFSCNMLRRHGGSPRRDLTRRTNVARRRPAVAPYWKFAHFGSSSGKGEAVVGMRMRVRLATFARGIGPGVFWFGPGEGMQVSCMGLRGLRGRGRSLYGAACVVYSPASPSMCYRYRLLDFSAVGTCSFVVGLTHPRQVPVPPPGPPRALLHMTSSRTLSQPYGGHSRRGRGVYWLGVQRAEYYLSALRARPHTTAVL